MASLQRHQSHGRRYYRIVESFRLNGKPRIRVLAHLGRADDIRRLVENQQTEVKITFRIAGAVTALYHRAAELDVAGRINRALQQAQERDTVVVFSSRLYDGQLRGLHQSSARHATQLEHMGLRPPPTVETARRRLAKMGGRQYLRTVARYEVTDEDGAARVHASMCVTGYLLVRLLWWRAQRDAGFSGSPRRLLSELSRSRWKGFRSPFCRSPFWSDGSSDHEGAGRVDDSDSSVFRSVR